MTDFNYKDIATKYPWMSRALNSPLRTDNNESVRTATYEADGIHYVVPTIRVGGDKLIKLEDANLDPFEVAKKNKDAIPFKTKEEADRFSQGFSDYLGSRTFETKEQVDAYKYILNNDRVVDDIPHIINQVDVDENEDGLISESNQVNKIIEYAKLQEIANQENKFIKPSDDGSYDEVGTLPLAGEKLVRGGASIFSNIAQWVTDDNTSILQDDDGQYYEFPNFLVEDNVIQMLSGGRSEQERIESVKKGKRHRIQPFDFLPEQKHWKQYFNLEETDINDYKIDTETAEFKKNAKTYNAIVQEKLDKYFGEQIVGPDLSLSNALDIDMFANALGESIPSLATFIASVYALRRGKVPKGLSLYIPGYTLEGSGAYVDALEKGYSTVEAEEMAILTGTINAFISTLRFGDLAKKYPTLFGANGKGLKEKINQKLIQWDAVSKKNKLEKYSLLQQAFKTVLTEAGKEGLEEGTQEVVGMGVQSLYGEEFTTEELIRQPITSAYMGTVAGGFSGPISSVSQYYSLKKDVKQLNEINKHLPHRVNFTRDGEGKLDFAGLNETDKKVIEKYDLVNKLQPQEIAKKYPNIPYELAVLLEITSVQDNGIKVIHDTSNNIQVLSVEDLLERGYYDYQNRFKNSLIKEGDSDYVEGKDQYRLVISGSNILNSDGTGTVILKQGANQDTFIEEQTELIYKRLAKADPELREEIDQYLDAVIKVFKENGERPPRRDELFSKLYTFNVMGYANEEIDISTNANLPTSIVEKFSKHFGATKDGEDMSFLYFGGESKTGALPVEAVEVAETVESVKPEVKVEPVEIVEEVKDDSEETFSIKTPKNLSNQKIATLKNTVYSLAEQGKDSRFWYEQSAQALLDAVDGDKVKAKKLLGIIAVTSAQMPVDTNFGQMVKAMYQIANGQEPKAGMFPTGNVKKIKQIMAGEDWTGFKTDAFNKNLISFIDNADSKEVTVDLWMARAYGLPTDAPSKLEYKKIEKDIQDISNELGWEPYQTQASIWVSTKAVWDTVKKPLTEKAKKSGILIKEVQKDGKVKWVFKSKLAETNFRKRLYKEFKKVVEKGIDKELLAKMNGDYSTALNKYRGTVSTETIPHHTTNTLPGIYNAPYNQKLEYHQAVNGILSNENGRDVIADYLGLLEVEKFDAPGFYEGTVYPSDIKDILFSSTGVTINPETKSLLNRYASIYGLITKQEAIGYSKEFVSPSKKQANTLTVELDEGVTYEQLEDIAQALKDAGLKDVGPTPTNYGFKIINYADENNIEFINQTEKVVENVLTNSDLTIKFGSAKSVGDLISNDWRKNQDGENYKKRLTEEGRPDSDIELVNRLTSDVEKVNQEFIEKYGWDKEETYSIKAYHGTSEQFTEFDTEKIGSGTGLQAFGWGLYFTDSKEIAKHYATQLAEREKKKIYGVTLHKGKDPSEYEYLDWRKPIPDNQRKKILDAINKHPLLSKASSFHLDRFKDGEPVKGLSLYLEIANHFERDRGMLSDENFNYDFQATSLLLKEAGIDGIAVIGRHSGDPSQYVVFDGKDVTIDDLEQTYSIKTPKTPKPKTSKDKIPSTWEGLKDVWFGNKDWENQKADIESANLQKEIQKTAKKGQDWKDIDRAILIYIDLKRNKGHYKKYKDKINPEQQRILEIAMNLTPEQKKIANKIGRLFEAVGRKTKKAGLINNILENYVNRVWNIEGKMTDETKVKFTQSTRHSKHRVYETILEGMADGLELRVTGATNSLNVLQTEINQAIENKRLIKLGLKMKDSNGKTLFSTKALDGYKRVDNPGFSTWKVVGKAKKKDSQVWSRDTFITDKGMLMQRVPIYAQTDVANNLNNILQKPFLMQFKAIKGLTNFGAVVKAWILQTSLFHHQAFARSYLMGGAVGQKGADRNPMTAYKKGLSEVKKLNPIIELLVRNGLTVGKIQDFDEHINLQKTTLGKILDKNNVTSKIQKRIMKMQDQQVRFLFNKFGAGLKAYAGILEYKKLLQEHPEMDPNVRAKMVANLINDDFGGLHQGRMAGKFGLNYNPTIYHLARLLLLAPDWTESNVRSMVKAVYTSKKEERELYRKFWGRIILRGMIATSIANLMVASFDTEEDENTLDAFVRRFRKAWNRGYLKWLDVDITPMYKGMGIEGLDGYFSLIGHFRDPVKFIVDPVSSAKHKGSYLFRVMFEALTGGDWRNRPFTSWEEFVGLDDEKGIYKVSKRNPDYDKSKPESEDNPKFLYKKGDSKAGKHKLAFTKWGTAHSLKLLDFSTVPKFISKPSLKNVPLIGGKAQIVPYTLAQVRGGQPIQVQNAMSYLSGELDGFTAIMKSIGVHQTATREKTRLHEAKALVKKSESKLLDIEQLNTILDKGMKDGSITRKEKSKFKRDFRVNQRLLKKRGK